MMNDFRYALRALARSPGVLLTAVLCLGLGIGANTTIFSLTSAVFLRPLPVPEPDQLVRLYSGWNGQRFRSSSYPEYQALAARADVFQSVAAYQRARVGVGRGEETSMEMALLATGGFFRVLGVQPAAGRFFTPDDDHVAGADPVVVISHAFWQARLAADPAVVGSTLHLNGRPYTIVGVAPAELPSTEPDQNVVAWLPFMSFRHILGRGAEFLQQGSHGLSLLARLQDGVAMDEARSAVTGTARAVASAHGSEWQTLRFNVLPGGTLASAQTSPEMGIVFILLNTVVGLVLLIACANVANIVLARGMSRRREIAIRLSLGSGRLRLVRQLLMESLLLGLAGGVAGLLLALWGTDLLGLFGLPPAIDPAPDRRVLVYVFTVAPLTGILFGLVPALQVTRVTLADALKHATRLGAPIRSRLRSTLVIGQVSLSVLLLVLAGLFLRAIYELRAVNTGVAEEQLLAVELDLTTVGVAETQGKLLFDRIAERISGLPGVESAALSTMVPSAGKLWMTRATLPEHDSYREQEFSLPYNTIGPNYLRTMGTPLVRGRTLTSQDREGQPRVALVNEAFVRRYFAGSNPLGQHVRTGDEQNWEIVGVVADLRYESVGAPAQPTLFVSYHQFYDSGLTLQVRTSGNPATLVKAIRRELYELQPGLAGTFRTFVEIRRGSEGTPRMVSTLLSIFGALALLLAALGLYGVTAYLVTLRTHEIGVRMALGARTAGVLGLFARQGLRLVLVGGAIGLLLALAAGQLLSSALYGISPFDPLVIGAVVLLTTTTSLIASLVPARRAARVDPILALRTE